MGALQNKKFKVFVRVISGGQVAYHGCHWVSALSAYEARKHVTRRCRVAFGSFGVSVCVWLLGGG